MPRATASCGAVSRGRASVTNPVTVETLANSSSSTTSASRPTSFAITADAERRECATRSTRSPRASASARPRVDAAVVDDDLFARVSRVTGFVTLARPRLTASQLAVARGILAELGEHARRAYAGDESTVPGRMRALGLDEREALGAVAAFVLTGTETIVSYVPRLAAILIDSGWLPRLAADRSLVDAAVAEGLRVTTPSPMMLRSVVEPRTLGGVTVKPGERILLGTYWADRALGDFDPDTNPAAQLKQLWFGAGAHYCLGAPLAMAQIRLTLGALLENPTLRVATRRPSRGVLIPSYASLELQRA